MKKWLVDKMVRYIRWNLDYPNLITTPAMLLALCVWVKVINLEDGK